LKLVAKFGRDICGTLILGNRDDPNGPEGPPPPPTPEVGKGTGG
jgi:hypothetical protein